ncbi:hypothetical protein IJJ53_01120 [Candidatus Saccharibacteria bacterium]|nr:hypothetical protein [Candidatus Saccharibacteria bacterium]
MGKSNTNNKSDKTGSYTEFCYHFFRNILLVSVPLLVISTLILGFATPHSSAEGNSSNNTSSDNVSLTLDVACTINGTVITPHTVTLNAGQVDHNVGNTKLSVFCNDNNGYNVYAVGSSGDIDGNTDLIYALNQNYNIKTGVYSNNSSNNPSSWAMKLTAGTGTATGSELTPPTIVNGYDNYSLIPNTYTQVANRTSGTSMTTDTNVSGSYLNTTYQIYASSVQPAGTYNGKVKYLILHPHDNRQTITSLDAAFALAGKTKAYQDETGSYFAMQDITTDICNSVTVTGEATTTQLVDIRDHKLYYVTKLSDGHCWMTQNLDLDIGDANTAPLNSNNTDISTTASGSGIYVDGYTVDSNNVWTWNPADSTITAGRNIDYNSGSVYGWGAGSQTQPYSAEGGDTYFYTSDSSANDVRFDTLSSCEYAGHTKKECEYYHIGNYYNWTATVASNNTNGANIQYDNAANSICPKGWRLPVATNDNQSVYEFGELLYEQGIVTSKTSTTYATDGFNNIRKSPLWFTRGGLITDNTLYEPNSYGGYYQSSTIKSNTTAFQLNFNKNNIQPASTQYTRRIGTLVRCLAR